jgi:hypothetical protein
VYLGPIPDDDISPVYLDARIGFTMDDDDDYNQLSLAAPLAIAYLALVHAAPYLESEERSGTWRQMADQALMPIQLSDSHARRSAKVARSMQEMG